MMVYVSNKQVNNTLIAYILKQKSLATQNLVGIIFIIKIHVLKMD